MSDKASLEKQLALREIEIADREIARLCEQIRALENRIKAQEHIRAEASRKLDRHA